MNFKLNSADFAWCMNKIMPAVSITKDKKEVIEGSIRISVSSQQRTENGYLSIAVAFDGKKQLLCAFLMQELEMEEETRDIYISGKKLCEISNVFNNGKDCPTIVEIEKDCHMRNGTSEIRFPLGEENVVLRPEERFIASAAIPTDKFLDLLRTAGSFYGPTDLSKSGICLNYDLKNSKLIISSTDLIKIAYGELAVEFSLPPTPEDEEGENGNQSSPTQEIENHIMHIIEGEQLKILSKFLEGDNTELFIYKSQLFLKSASDIAIFLVKDSSEYPLDHIIDIANKQTGKAKIQMLISDMIDAMKVFNVANQEEQPYLHVGKEQDGMMYFQTTGKTGKTLIHGDIEGEVDEIIIHAKLFRQLLSVFPKEAKVMLIEGEADEPLIIKEKENSTDFVMLPLIELPVSQ